MVSIAFQPKYTITPAIARLLMRIEAAKEAVASVPITLAAQARLRETARLLSTHCSTQIEGNRLTLEEATGVITRSEHFPGRTRDEEEVLGYYRAMDEMERLSRATGAITEPMIQTLHAHVLGGERGKVKPTPYRDGQNVIRDGGSGRIVYLPPEATDVALLMSALVRWIESTQQDELPCPLRAAISHYQFATIHPYYDGNGRTARLLATLILYKGGYDLKGFYSIEEYYARDLPSYYTALAVGPSHNYYMGRAEADITASLEYFCRGMATSFEAVRTRANEARKPGHAVHTQQLLRGLDTKQRKVITHFKRSDTITATQIAKLFGLQPRTARNLCHKWAMDGFLVTTDLSNKNRRYALDPRFEGLTL